MSSTSQTKQQMYANLAAEFGDLQYRIEKMKTRSESLRQAIDVLISASEQEKEKQNETPNAPSPSDNG